MMLKRAILLMGVVAMVTACSDAAKPLVYKHPETKSIILLQGEELQCEPLFRKAGFERVDAGAGQ